MGKIENALDFEHGHSAGTGVGYGTGVGPDDGQKKQRTSLCPKVTGTH